MWSPCLPAWSGVRRPPGASQGCAYLPGTMGAVRVMSGLCTFAGGSVGWAPGIGTLDRRGGGCGVVLLRPGSWGPLPPAVPQVG